MKKFKKFFAFLLAVLMMVSLMACGAKQEESQGSAGAPAEAEKEPVKISYMIGQADYNEAYQIVADKIKEDHGYEVEFQVVPDGEFKNLLQVKLASSEAPDIFQTLTPNENSTYDAYTNCVDLSEESWVSRLSNPGIAKDPTDGKIYAMPLESASGLMAVFYNKQVLKDCGIEDPHPTTYAEFLEILETIKQKGNGVTPIYMTCADSWTMHVFMTAGYPISLNETRDEVYGKLLTNELKWTEVPEMKAVLDQYMELYDRGYVNEDAVSATYDMAAEKLATGQAAMYLSVDAFAIDLLTKYPDCELGSFVIPYNDVEKMCIGSYVKACYVPNSGKQVDETLKFLEIWSSPEYRTLYHESQPGFDAFSDADGGDVPECVTYLVDNYVNTGAYVFENDSYMTIVGNLNADLLSYYGELVTGIKTSEDFLESYQRIYEDYMQQIGQPGF